MNDETVKASDSDLQLKLLYLLRKQGLFSSLNPEKQREEFPIMVPRV